jgi:heme exporter protein B
LSASIPHSPANAVADPNVKAVFAAGDPSGTITVAFVPKAAPFCEQALAVFSKDLRCELRNRAAINSILLFSVTALIVVGFSVGGTPLQPRAQAALLWVVLFFAAFSGLAHIFLHEEEAGTTTALRLTTSASAVYAGKLLFNLILLMAIAAIVVPLFVLMVGVNPEQPVAFIAVILFGGLGLGAAATIVAAIIAKARGKGALYGALGFPILLPLLFMAVDATQWTLVPDAGASGLGRDMVGLVSFAVMLVTANWLLFPVIWED